MKHKFLFALIMGSITTGVISFTLTAINLGFTGGFIATWLSSWGIAYLVALPAILIISPIVMRLVNHLLAGKHTIKIQQ